MRRKFKINEPPDGRDPQAKDLHKVISLYKNFGWFCRSSIVAEKLSAKFNTWERAMKAARSVGRSAANNS